MAVQIFPVKTRAFQGPKDDVEPALLESLPPLENGDIIVVTSKVVAIGQGRCVPLHEVSKEELVEREADAFIPKASSRYGITLSIKDNTLIASAGIDESNSGGYYVLWPTDPAAWAETFCRAARAARGVRELAVIVSDSHCIPLRWGVVGISIGFFGLHPLHDYRGAADIFGRELQVTQSNIPDAVAAAAVGVMGEGSECTPMAIVRGWPRVRFTDTPSHAGFHIDPESDIFAPLLSAFRR